MPVNPAADPYVVWPWARTIAVTRNEMLAAWDVRNAHILAPVPVEDGFVHRPIYLPDPARLFGGEPGFAEVFWVEAIRWAIPRERTMARKGWKQRCRRKRRQSGFS